MGKFKRIVLHWTAGVYKANATDKSHYHFLIEYNKKNDTVNLINGVYKPEDNIDCNDGAYAHHCGGGNTGAIGVSLCCMRDSSYPVARRQFERACDLIAELCIKYSIPVNRFSVLTHAEFGRQNPHTTSNGKIDINNLHCLAIYGIDNVGKELRKKVNYYINRRKNS